MEMGLQTFLVPQTADERASGETASSDLHLHTVYMLRYNIQEQCKQTYKITKS